MATVSELKRLCKKIGKEYGKDTLVEIQVKDDYDTKHTYWGECLEMICKYDGNILLTNYKLGK